MKDYLRDVAKKNEERRTFFSSMLERGESLEKVRKAALEYFDERIQETMEEIDFAWGDRLMMACALQNKYKEKRKEVEKASTAAQIVAIVG